MGERMLCEDLGTEFGKLRGHFERTRRLARRLVNKMQQENEDLKGKNKKLERMVAELRDEIEERAEESHRLAKRVGQGDGSTAKLCPSCFRSRGLTTQLAIATIGDRRCHDCGTLVPDTEVKLVDRSIVEDHEDRPTIMIGMKGIRIVGDDVLSDFIKGQR